MLSPSFTRSISSKILLKVFSPRITSLKLCSISLNNEIDKEEEKMSETPLELILSSEVKAASYTRELLKTYYGLGDQKINHIFRRFPSVRKYDEKTISRQSEIFNKYSIDTCQIEKRASLIAYSPDVLENMILIMKESCIPLNPHYLLYIRKLMNHKISYLKEKEYLPNYVDLIDRYTKVLNLNREVRFELLKNLPEDISNMTLIELRLKFLSHYLAWILESNTVLTDKSIHANMRIRYKCYEFIKGNFDILTNNFSFSKEKILTNGYLLFADPYNLTRIISDVKYLGTATVQEIAQKRPKILLKTSESLKEIDFICKQHEVLPESLVKEPGIFTLSSKTIKTRFKNLVDNPDLAAFKDHPRVPTLIYYQRKALMRVKELKERQIPVPTLHQLACPGKKYSKLLTYGIDKFHQNDIVYLLKKYFGKSFEEVKTRVKQHPHWTELNINDVHESLLYLHGLNIFSKEKIFNTMTVIFYSKNKLEKEINRLIELKDPPLDSDFFFEMVLYNLEKEHHFTGSGIWENESPHRAALEEKAEKKKRRETSKMPIEVIDELPIYDSEAPLL